MLTAFCNDHAHPSAVYPSIMRAHTLCHSTIVLDPAYDNLPSYRYKEVDIPGMGAVRFAQTDDTVLPALLEELAAFRKEARRKQAAAKAAGDHFAASIFNGQQLAYKVRGRRLAGVHARSHAEPFPLQQPHHLLLSCR